MIRFTSVSKYYPGDVPGIVDVSVEIPDGEFVFLIGPSGSGKTTFLRLLIRDLVPTDGELTVDDWNIGNMKKANVHLLRRNIGIVFQDFKLLTDRTVYENVAMVLEILNKSPGEISERVMNILHLVWLADKKNLFPQQLSAGEMQRTGIARAIVGGPRILLADEPTGNLDPDTSDTIIDILEEIQRLGTTVIMATHNVDIVNKLKKRTITIDNGKVVRDESRGRYHHVRKHAHDHKHAKDSKDNKDKKEEKHADS